MARSPQKPTELPFPGFRTQGGSATIAMGSIVFVDLAVTGHENSVSGAATVDDVSVN